MRWVVVVAVLLATTFSGLRPQSATAAELPATRAALPASVNLAEVVFSFGDALDAVNYEVGFEPDARNLDRLTAACRSVLSREPTFESAVQSTRAKDIAHDLLADAQPTIDLCFDPLSADEDAEGRAAQGFAEFHELAFDFAAAVSD